MYSTYIVYKYMKNPFNAYSYKNVKKVSNMFHSI